MISLREEIDKEEIEKLKGIRILINPIINLHTRILKRKNIMKMIEISKAIIIKEEGEEEVRDGMMIIEEVINKEIQTKIDHIEIIIMGKKMSINNIKSEK